MEVAAEDLWNDPTMRVLAVELELWHFLSCNEASELLVRRKGTVTGLVIQSVREIQNGGTRAVFLPHYWFACLIRMVQLRKQMRELIVKLWQYRQEVSYGDAVIVEKLRMLTGNLVERIPSVIISEIPQLNLHDVEMGYVKAQTVLCQMALLMEDSSENESLMAPMIWLVVKGHEFHMAGADCLNPSDVHGGSKCVSKVAQEAGWAYSNKDGGAVYAAPTCIQTERK